MAKVERVEYAEGGVSYWFTCPGCGSHHAAQTKRNGAQGPQWTFNGDIDKPTFSPSLRVRWNPPSGEQQCHFHVTDGKIIFCSDSTHAFAGRTLDLPDLPPGGIWGDA